MSHYPAPGCSLAPPGQIGWSGQNWYRQSGLAHPSISVIESPSESYDAYRERKNREVDARKVPFGFARALAEPTPASGSAS